MENLRLYQEGDFLQENEWLLKIRPPRNPKYPNTGFLTKLTQKGKLPMKFEDWNYGWWEHDNHGKLPIYIFKEEYNTGWKIFGSRFGESQNWAIMIHPLGFTLEIHMNEFIDLLEKITVINGELQGKFRWNKTKLEQQE